MLELYALSSAARIALAVLGCGLVAVQSAYALYGVHARGIDEPMWGLLAEWGLLPLYLLLAFLPAAAQVGIEDGLIVVGGYDAPRYICGALAAVAGIGCGAMARRIDLAGNGLLAIFLMPFMDAGRVFLPLFSAMMICGLLRAGARAVLLYRRRRREITYASIKEAIDQLPGGLMFYESNGFIRLMNRRMSSLMSLIMGQEARDGAAFWNALCPRPQAEGLVIRKIEGRVLRFTCLPAMAGRREIYGLRAVDVTELWEKRRTLEVKRMEISRGNEAIQRMIEDMEQIRLAQEAGRTWRRIHDVIGLRVSLLQRMLREELWTDVGALLPLMENIMEEIRGDGRQSADMIIAEVLDTFSAIGVQIHMEGDLPSDPEAAHVFVTAIREGAVNAVRHARAKNVFAHFSAPEGYRELRVENDGDPPAQVIEGDGLSAMRAGVESMGGSMSVSARPRFALILLLPERSGI